ncbi:MAG: hypothetical protein V4438_03330 [Patescibacteria group bacterium]
MKTLVIINGVTGAIGTACLARFSREIDTTIIGLSRKAKPYYEFVRDGHLPDKTIICNVGDPITESGCKSFVGAIDHVLYEKIIYVHALGVYPFEIDIDGNVKVSNDADGDGIDDKVVELSYNAFFAMVTAIRSANKPLDALIFGGVADKHKPAVHKSWWTVMQIVKENMKKIVQEGTDTNFFVLNISSVICPHEILTRPFVFEDTNADPRFWLMPHEVAEEVANLTLSDTNQGFIEQDLFHKADYYQDDYFTEEKFTDRKKAELGIK